MITIITPTYNRAHTLPILYKSLVEQNSKNFEWLIIDDGSVDNTADIIRGFISESNIKIRYFKKGNGGKHTALNMGFKKTLTDWILIVDSDDFLKQCSIKYLIEEVSKLNNDYISISFLKAYPDGRTVGNNFDKSVNLKTYLDRINQNISGDKADLIRTDALKGFVFPEFNGENFMAESPMFLWLSKKGKTKFINFDGYICEYLDGGLSDNSINNRHKCVHSTLYVYSNQYKNLPSKKLKIKAAVNWWRFKIFKRIDVVNNNRIPIIFFPLGLILYANDKIKKRVY